VRARLALRDKRPRLAGRMIRSMRQLTSLDQQFLALEDGRIHGHASALGIYDPRTVFGRTLDVRLVRELVGDRLHLLPTFRWRLVSVPLGLDYDDWVDDGAVDVEYHVRELALPAPGDRHQLAEQVARIISRPLDRTRPLWELYVFEGLEDGAVALLVKMHHAAVDGISGAEVMSVLLDETPEERLVRICAERCAERRPGELEMLARGLAGMPRQPWRALRAVPRTLPHLDAVPTIRPIPGVKTIARTSRRALRLLPRAGDDGPPASPDLTAPRTRFQDRISAHRRVAFGSLSLDEVKAVKNACGFTVNDVVMALCATALRRWLSKRGELPYEPLVAFVPVSVRTPEQAGTYGNRVSVMLAELSTDEADPLERLRRVHRTMRAAKVHHQRLPASLLEDANHFILPALFARAAKATVRVTSLPGIQAPVNVAISNVPGSPRPLYCAGARQRSQYPVSGVLDGIGLNITVVSYCDRLEFGIVADREQLDDPWQLIAALTDALAELRALTDARPHDTGAIASAPAVQR
jgi:diacylglycerol O-acyltransferase / wax synthase